MKAERPAYVVADVQHVAPDGGADAVIAQTVVIEAGGEGGGARLAPDHVVSALQGLLTAQRDAAAAAAATDGRQVSLADVGAPSEDDKSGFIVLPMFSVPGSEELAQLAL